MALGDPNSRPTVQGSPDESSGTLQPPSRSTSDDDSSDSDWDDETSHHDGHRPALREIRSTYSRRSIPRRSDSLASSIATQRQGPARSVLSRRNTALSKIRSRPVPVFSHPLAHVPTTSESIVDFDGPDDPYKPINWPMKKKITTTMLYGFVTMTATFASASYSAATPLIAKHFAVSDQVATLGTTLFLFGFGLGPLIWAPLSEVYGRRLAVLTPMLVAICFNFASATSKDLQTLMITRFFGAFFASAPVTNTGGVLGDLFTPMHRGIAMAGYAMAVVGGPVLGEFHPIALPRRCLPATTG